MGSVGRSSKLNPLAPAFVPKAYQQLPAQASTLCTVAQADARGFGQLPDEVLAAVFSHLGQLKDVLACAMASRHLQTIVGYAPLRLHICEEEFSELSASDLAFATNNLRLALKTVCKRFKGIQMLDLSNTWVDDADISQLVEECPELRVVKLAGCRKLAAVSETLLTPDTGVKLECVSLHRCFQTRNNALGELLEAAASSKQSLQCITVSHLDLRLWPKTQSQQHTDVPKDNSQLAVPILSSDAECVQQLPAAQPFSSLSGSSLTALAVHNCHGLTPAGLQVMAAACPKLQLLFLGGSSIHALKRSSQAPPASAAGHIPLLNSIPRSRAAAIAGVLKKCSPSQHPAAHAIAAELAAIVADMPDLSVLEITFMPSGTRTELRSMLADSCSDRCIQILDLCEPQSIETAVAYSNIARLTCYAKHDGHAKCGAVQAYAGQLIQTAVHCSNSARQTPLHVAVEVDDASAVEALLELGSGVNARDKGGATPLFLACEAGHAACAKLLLGAGANILQSNSAGETPLYIAALRGELLVVDVLLHHMKQQGICWQDGQLYGDGWTPLMAAAVADRHNIAVRLLSAAGGAVGTLVGHANRYGQTAVHIAARKGSLPLLTALLAIGGPIVATARDCVGTSPVDIASKNNHTAAVELLCSVAARSKAPKTALYTQQLLE